MPPKDPNDPDTTDDDQVTAREDIANYGPAEPLAPDSARALGSQGLGGKRIVEREASRLDDVKRGIGTNEPPLTIEAREQAMKTSLEIQQARLDQRRAAVMSLPEGSERSDQLARIQVEQEKSDKKRAAL
jgi:hypothetical protein